MDYKSYLFNVFEQNQKKFVVLATGCLIVYLSYKFVYQLTKRVAKPELTAEQIRKIIEDLPFDSKNSETNLSLKDLLDELKDLDDDDE
ncbi:hypothetical protein BDFB_009663 [Asbolus verrucosus]|uniref:Uncharacterized protein n=1 Tax=Asbolus verrucosus TaxID=1661398 RepID=A0A482W2R8_ASBVE|nr:hypothetical protein BDFB_009663 [Asbolus verrucosus]